MEENKLWKQVTRAVPFNRAHLADCLSTLLFAHMKNTDNEGTLHAFAVRIKCGLSHLKSLEPGPASGAAICIM